MSKRYGRNQKRQHRDRITELEALVVQLDLEKYGGFGKCTNPSIPVIDGDFLFYNTRKVQEFSRDRHSMTIETSILVETAEQHEKIHAMHGGFGDVSFCGLRCRLKSIVNPNSGRREFYSPELQLEFEVIRGDQVAEIYKTVGNNRSVTNGLYP